MLFMNTGMQYKGSTMRKLIIALIITNIILIVQIAIDRKQEDKSELNNKIVIEELIPIEELEE